VRVPDEILAAIVDKPLSGDRSRAPQAPDPVEHMSPESIVQENYSPSMVPADDGLDLPEFLDLLERMPYLGNTPEDSAGTHQVVVCSGGIRPAAPSSSPRRRSR
jgi:hypothetical protein